MSEKSLGHIAYDAYGAHQAWVAFDGKPIPPSFESQRPDIAAAWEAAGKAVAQYLRLQTLEDA